MDIIRRAIGYIRVSTQQQDADDKYGIDIQKSAISLWAAEHGFAIV